MAVLILGAGYIGSSLAGQLLDSGEDVVALDNLFSTDERVLARFESHPGFRLIRGDVADASAVDSAFQTAAGCRVVFNLAAQASANPAAASAEYTEVTNLRGPRVVLDAMRRYDVRTMVFGGSLRVYGDSLPALVDEWTPYGRFADLSHLSKCYVEKLMEMYAGEYGLRCLSVRLGLVYGVAPVMKTDYRFMTAPNKFSLQAVRGEELVARGSGSLGFIHVADAARALRVAGEHEGFDGYVAVNAATEVTTVAEVARLVVAEGRRRGFPVSLRIVGEQAEGTCDLRSRLRETAFVPGHDLRRGIGEAIDYFLMGARR